MEINWFLRENESQWIAKLAKQVGFFAIRKEEKYHAQYGNRKRNVPSSCGIN